MGLSQAMRNMNLATRAQREGERRHATETAAERVARAAEEEVAERVAFAKRVVAAKERVVRARSPLAQAQGEEGKENMHVGGKDLKLPKNGLTFIDWGSDEEEGEA